MKKLSWFGQADTSVDLAAWETYLKALRDNLKGSWSRAVAAYLGLKSARTNLGLPFIVNAGSPEAGSAPGYSPASAWSSDLDQQAVDLMAMVTLINSAIDDVIAGKRKLNYLTDQGVFQIEGLPADLLRLDLQGEVPVLIETKSNQPTHVQGTVGVPALVWAATLTTSVLALPAYFIVEKAVDALTNVAEQKTLRTVAEKSYECVQTGKCTPEQAQKINQSIYSGATALRAEKVKEIEAASKPTTDITSTIKTVALVALGLGVLYAIVRLVPPAGARSRSTALAVRQAA